MAFKTLYKFLKPCVRLIGAFLLFCVLDAKAQELPTKIGFIGSLSSFAGNYGTAVLDGARLALSDLNGEKNRYELVVEDDHSNSKDTVTAYKKLVEVDHVKIIIGGTWWANAIVKLAERDGVILLSCETMFNDDMIFGKTNFVLGGDLREWVRAYEPLLTKLKLRHGAAVHFVSGFGATIAREMESLFSREGRTFIGAVEYQDIQANEAGLIAIKLKQLNPEVVYIDGQPAGLANLLKKILNLGLNKKMLILTNAIARDMFSQGLLKESEVDNLYFTERPPVLPAFETKFRSKYSKASYLHADLGYYATLLADKAMTSTDPVAYLKGKPEVEGMQFEFNESNVYVGKRPDIYTVRLGKIEQL